MDNGIKWGLALVRVPYATYAIKVPSDELENNTFPKIPYSDGLKGWIHIPVGIKRFIAQALLKCGKLEYQGIHTESEFSSGGIDGSIMVCKENYLITQPDEIITCVTYTVCDIFPWVNDNGSLWYINSFDEHEVEDS
jgi:hypothetical protein